MQIDHVNLSANFRAGLFKEWKSWKIREWGHLNWLYGFLDDREESKASFLDVVDEP